MNRKTELRPGGFAAFCLAVSLAGCGLSGSSETKAASAPPSPQPVHDPLEIKVAQAIGSQLQVGMPSWAQVNESLDVPGRIEADETRIARAGSPVPGRVAEIHVVEGQRVKRGQPLAALHSTDLSEAQFGFLRAQSQSELARRAAERARQLVDAGVIGVAEQQRREAEHAQFAAELVTWRDRLRVLGMQEDAVARLEKTRAVNSLSQVVASIDGVVLERKITPGQVVQPADTLFVIGDLSQVWLVADVPEQESGPIRAGKLLEAEIPALPGRAIRGRLSFVSAIVQSETRTVRVRMDLSNPELLYKPAMLANIHLQGQPERKLVIPATAVVREGNQDWVFLETAHDTFRMKSVALGPEFGDKRVITAGVNAEQRIVLDGAFHLNNERKRASLQGE